MTSDDSVYRAPESSLSRPSEGSARSLESAIAGDFQIDVVEIMGEAWDLVNGSKMIFFGGAAILFGINVLAGGLSAVTQGSDPAAFNPLGAAISLASAVVMYPIQAGIFLYAVRRAGGDDAAGFDDIFSCFGQTLPIVGLMILQGLLVLVGFLLLVIPGIYLVIAYFMALPLLVERGLGVWESLETSRKAITNAWFQVFLLGFTVGAIVILGGMLTLGIGLIWLLPFGWLCLGVTYCRVFGYSGSPG